MECSSPVRRRRPRCPHPARIIRRPTSPAAHEEPALGDPHPEHKASHILLHSALSRISVNNALVLQYEGLVPLGDANWWLNIGEVVDEKRRRLAEYRSQDELYGLVETTGYLNAYRGRTLLRRSVAHAEAYTRMTIDGYLKRQCQLDRVS